MVTASRIGDVLPLAPLQEGLLFHALFDVEGAEVYNAQFTMDLGGEVDPARLRAAMTAVLARHPQLGGAFRYSRAGQPVLVVPRGPALPWEEVDLREPGEDRAKRRQAYIDEDRVRPFDPRRAPLLRCALLRTADDAWTFVFTHHHVLLDGWSLGVLVRELLRLYASGGDPSELPAAPAYRGYLDWLAGRDRDAARTAWREALAGLPGPTLLAPPDPARVARLPHTVERTLSSSATERLTAFARNRGITLNTLLQGAWSLLLGQQTNSRDVVFGAIVSGRPPELPGSGEMVGLFINAVPVRARQNPGETVTDFLTRLQREQVALTDHQHLPLGEIVELTGRAPLFDTLVVFESYPLDSAGLRSGGGALTVRGMGARDATHYPLALIVVPAEQLRLRLSYRTDLFEPSTAEHLLERLDRILDALVSDPDRLVARLDLLTAAERVRVVTEFNRTARRLPPASLLEMLTRQAHESAGRTALICGEQSLTYAELHDRADRLARDLVRRGAGPEEVVGLLLPRSVDLVVAILAVLRSGAAYLPFDRDQPAARIELMVREAEPLLVLTSAEPADAAAPADAPVSAEVRPDHPAYVMYTSGSTGMPKAVVLPHAGLVNRLLWMQEAYGLQPGDRVLQKTPATFDVSVWEFLWPLTTGATLVLALPDRHGDPAYLVDEIRAREVTVAHFVPSVLRAFLAEPEVAECRSLRHVICSGEALTPDLVRDFRAVLRSELHNLYGPTEASIDVTAWTCDDGTNRVPIGRPVANTRAYVLDAQLRPVPVGVTGELYLGGVQLARGYRGKPALTAQRFVGDPFGPPGSRLYRTGDLARWAADGTLDYAGRADDQIKIRGVRIEPGEITAVLAGHPEVAQATVVTRADGPGEAELVAYVVPAGADPEPADLRHHLAAHLPDVMIPRHLVVLDRLPVTSNGKLDRRALPAPERVDAEPGRAPRSPREELLCELFAEALGVPSVGPDDDFFAAGGHSLRAARLAGRVRDVFGVDVTVRSVFTAPTAADFAEQLDHGRPDDPFEPVLALRARGSRPALFCIHPAGGLGWSYAGLLRHVGREYPVHALQSPGLSGSGPEPATMAELARDYARRIRAIQPDGPYHLLGWSFGGVAAHAVAGELRAQGASVGLLAVLDAYPKVPGAADHRPQPADILAGLLLHAGHRPEGHEAEQLDVDGALTHLRATGSAFAGLTRDQLDAAVRVFQHNYHLQHTHDPGPFDGDLVFFEATRGRGPDLPVVEDWQPFVGGRIVRHRIACEHGLMTRPEHLAVVGRVIAEHLRHTAARLRTERRNP